MTPFAFLKPRSLEPDEYRKELILNVILGFCMAIISLFFFMVLGNALHGKSYIGISHFLIIASPIAGAYRMSRTGRIRTASYIVILFFSAGLLYAAYAWGAILPTVLLGIAFISTCASLLLGARAGFSYAIAAACAMLAIQALHEYGVHRIDFSWTGTAPDYADIIEYSIFILFISGISWLSNSQMESALNRARASERDLSIERDSLETKVAERTKALEQAQIEKTTEMYRFVEFGKLSAGLIHDLMSPLTAICLETAPGDPRAPALESIVGASRKIQDIIQATRRQIKAEFASERIPVLSIIDEVLLIHQSRIKKGGITVRKSMPMSLYLNGSPSLLSHLLTNLISNAIDALADAEHPTLEIYASRNPTCVKITVRDNGIGIPDDIATSIFDPFFTTKKHSGWGYGLSASRHIVQKYFGGEISLDKTGSASGSAKTSFSLTLPLVPVSAPHPQK